MKQLIKKLMMACVLCLSLTALVACQKEKVQTVDPQIEAQLKQNGEGFMQQLASMDEAQLDKVLEDAESNHQTVIFNAVTNYKEALDDLGAFKSVDQVTVQKEKKGYLVVVDSSYEKRTLKLEMGLDDKLSTYTDLTFTPHYSVVENLESALANMVVGMGTVFVILIFISWVISQIKHVNRLGKKKAAKAAAAAPAPVSAPAAASEPEEEELVDDAALVAVITAAIAAYEETGSRRSLNNGLVVRSIRRHKNSSWNK